MILTNLYNRGKLCPVGRRKVISTPNSSYMKNMKDITIDGKLYRQVNHLFIYVCTHNSTHCQSFVEWCDNGGVSGEYFTVINKSLHIHVNIWGTDNDEIAAVPIATVVALDHSQAGIGIIIMHQFVYHGKGKRNNYYMKIEWYKNDLNEKSLQLNGFEQQIFTHEGYVSPLHF